MSVVPESDRLTAIEAIYRARGADLFRVALAKTQDPDRARDAVHEGFARAIRSRRGFRGSGPLEAWVFRCVLNAARDEAGRTRRDVPIEVVVDRSLETEPDPDSVRAAVLLLPQRQREALFLRYYLDLDYQQIADVLGVRRGTVAATLHAARTALGHALKEVA
jgi:RNA polymerase sigma factor (sigma-70 family)